jgi:hypothetical protein
MQLRQSVNIWVGSFVYLVVIRLSVLCMTISSALKQVCRLGSLFDICISAFVGLKIS